VYVIYKCACGSVNTTWGWRVGNAHPNISITFFYSSCTLYIVSKETSCLAFWQRMDYCDCSWKNHAHFYGRYVAWGRSNLVLQRGLHHHKAGDSIGSFLLTLPAGTTVPDHLLQRLLLFLSPPPLSVLLFRRKENLLFLYKHGKVLAFSDVRCRLKNLYVRVIFISE